MEFRVPKGFRFAGVHSGVKRDPKKPDLALVVSDAPAVAAGVYTQNLVFAAPVAVDRARTPADGIRAVVINSGNANACTGDRGIEDARAMAASAAAVCGADDKRFQSHASAFLPSMSPPVKIGPRRILAVKRPSRYGHAQTRPLFPV